MNRRKLFKYNIVHLIELVEKRPLIWDKTSKHHKNKIKKANAWREIYRSLDNNYDKADEKAQRNIGEVITTKWIYIRDAFNKSMRTAATEGPRKKYIYYKLLKFLLKNGDAYQMDVSQLSSRSPTPPPAADDEPSTASVSCLAEQRSPVATTTLGIKRKIETMKKEIVHLRQDSDDDDAFFQSIKPAVARMAEDDKYEFRMGVMRLIQQIKKRRQNTSPPLSALPAKSHSMSSDQAQPLLKQYAPNNSHGEESDGNSGSEQYSYMLLAVKNLKEETAAEEVSDTDALEV